MGHEAVEDADLTVVVSRGLGIGRRRRKRTCQAKGSLFRLRRAIIRARSGHILLVVEGPTRKYSRSLNTAMVGFRILQEEEMSSLMALINLTARGIRT